MNPDSDVSIVKRRPLGTESSLHDRLLDRRLIINVGGSKFETWLGTLERIPGE